MVPTGWAAIHSSARPIVPAMHPDSFPISTFNFAETRWLNIDKWDACNGELPDLDGLTCYAGLDLSSTTDLSALVVRFEATGF